MDSVSVIGDPYLYPSGPARDTGRGAPGRAAEPLGQPLNRPEFLGYFPQWEPPRSASGAPTSGSLRLRDAL
jgi:hypothetical protein